MINKVIIYKFSKDFTNLTKRTNKAIVLAVDLSPFFFNIGTIDEVFQKSGKQGSFIHMWKSLASVCESSASQFFKKTLLK